MKPVARATRSFRLGLTVSLCSAALLLASVQHASTAETVPALVSSAAPHPELPRSHEKPTARAPAPIVLPPLGAAAFGWG
ncbi:MAG TPA: hypothetical protein VME92_08355 [Acetobacteraceae bacterium]|nr:hypothetical protein [Acetobacteraceae bacterium]